MFVQFCKNGHGTTENKKMPVARKQSLPVYHACRDSVTNISHELVMIPRTGGLYAMSAMCFSSLIAFVSTLCGGGGLFLPKPRFKNKKKKGRTHASTWCPTLIGGYTTSSPSSLPSLVCSSLSLLALSASAGTGARSKSEQRCQKRVLEMRMSGRAGFSASRRRMASRVWWLTTTSW